MVNHVSDCVYKVSYQPNCTRLKIWFPLYLSVSGASRPLSFVNKYCPILYYGVNPILSLSSRHSLCGVHLSMQNLFRQSTVVQPQDVPEPSIGSN